MAKLRVTASVPESTKVSDFHNFDFGLGRHNKTSASFLAEGEFADGDAFRIVFEGKNLAYKGGELVKGTVTKITYEGLDGTDLAAVTGIKLNARNLPSLTGNEFYENLFGGNDAITGSAIKDYLVGGAGDDTLRGLGGDDWLDGGSGVNSLTGGAGRDDFLVQFGSSAIITDFDASSNTDGQIALYGRYFTVLAQLKQVGDDAEIKFDDGNFVRLLNVNVDDLVYEDFLFVGPFQSGDILL